MTILGVPCFLGENTERPATITRDIIPLVGTGPRRSTAAVAEAHEQPSRPVNMPELRDGYAAERMVDIVQQRFADA